MKIYLNLLIIVVKICASENFDYNWNVRTVESDRNFGDDLKVQTALNNERLEILKTSDKASNMEYSPSSYYKRFDKSKNNSNKVTDDKEKEQILLRNGTDIKYEEKPNLDKVELKLNQIKNKTDSGKVASKIYNNTDYINNNAADYEYNEDHENNYITNQNAISNDYHEPEINSGQRIEGVLKNMLLKKHEELNDQFYDQYNDDLYENNKEKSININDQFDVNDEPKIIGHRNEKIETEDSKIFNKLENKLNVIDNRLNKHSNLAKDSFVGTNLFDSTVKKCFSTEDVALLKARKNFENLIPKDLPQSLLDDHKVALLMNYFYVCHQIVLRSTDADTRNIAQRAFYDTLGGYLNFYMVPVTKYSFYAGKISLNTAQQVFVLHEESRKFLNTNGNGWKMPPRNVLLELKSAHIEPFHISDLMDDIHQPSFCMHLDLNTDETHPSADNMLVELPKLDVENTKGFLGNIWLPYKRKRIFDLKSERSAFIVVKFYETLTKCYRFENIDQASYNERFKTWLVENVNLHLSDEEFYPGLGAVLRIYEYLKTCKKDKGYRNDYLTEFEKAEYRNHKIGNNQLNYNKRTKHSENEEKPTDLNKDDNNNKRLEQSNTQPPPADVDQKTREDVEKDNKMEGAVQVPTNAKSLLRSLDLNPTQIAIIAVPIVIFVLLIIICCNRSAKKRKAKAAKQGVVKHSSSSSSNLFNSPVRFFHVKKKNPANEASNKKNKKSSKPDKKQSRQSDTSASSSPVRNKKSKSGKSSKLNQVGKRRTPPNS